MTTLINEMHVLREVVGDCNDDLTYAPFNAGSRTVLGQKEATAEKLLAVQLEIGRRVKARRIQ